MIRYSAFLLAAILCACATGEPLPPFDVTSAFREPAPFAIPGTGIVVPTPDFARADFVTTAEVGLRSGQDEESPVTTVVPEGTPAIIAGVTGSECLCEKIATPLGVGWVNTRFVALRPFAPPIDRGGVLNPAMAGSAGSSL